ncbi:tetratricopeptide repeat protein 34 [Hemicordylus capensis]|uniref:tetratricopeptide repeat protein 34 n=1 Tax=Hemicordylus capensis TaxID=884348 RepID=UPI0023044953|nr:tetratricopeptide repeat protein 34 [Hemicordylus capensis]
MKAGWDHHNPQPVSASDDFNMLASGVAGDGKISKDISPCKEQAAQLCTEGDRCLATDELSLATAYYMAAFSVSAPVAVEKVLSLGKESRLKVTTTLEAWCQGGSPIPKVPCGNLTPPAPNVGIAAVFLSTLSPHNMAATLYKMEALLRVGRCQEVVSRCDSLLDAHPSLELLLTRALALVVSGCQDGVVEYLRAFGKCQEETVEFVRSRHKEYLQQILQAAFDFIACQKNSVSSQGLESWQGGCYNFLVAIAPEDIRVCQAWAAHLFERHKYQECVSVYSKALEALSASSALWDERASDLLMDRAAAYFSLGGRVEAMIRDLTAAFEAKPSLAKSHFEALFSASDAERIEKHARAALDAEFVAYREAVRTRPEVRSDSGKEMLSAVLRTLKFLIQIAPGARRELNVRLADCYLLEGNTKEALEICNHLLESEQETYHNTLLALRGFCHLQANCHQEALQDFQKIVEHNSPHPSSCVKALCGRGLIRALGGSPYLTALDYITACRLRSEDTAFAIKSYVPWNQRGFLLTVLQEEAQKILGKNPNQSGNSAPQQNRLGTLNGFQTKEGDASGVHQLAVLLMELDASSEPSQILCADALYQMDRGEEAHKILLVALSKTSQKSAILARLALLQLKKGFLYDCNQILKKMIQTGDICCFQTFVKVLRDEDQQLMQKHCHARAVTILKHKPGEGYFKEAILYLSFAIAAAGGFAVDSLLTRARCYGHLGQKKTAIFDFNAILKVDPGNVQALSGRGFIHLSLNQKKEAVQDLTSALKADPGLAAAEILSLRREAQSLIHGWLLEHCRAVLLELSAAKEPPAEEVLKDLAVVGESLVKIRSKETESHILYVDILAAEGRHKEALAYLQESFGQSMPDDSVNSRLGILQAQRRNVHTAAHILANLAANDYKDLGFLMNFLDNKQRQSLAQVASKEGNALARDHCHTKAVGYYSLAVLASNRNPQYLRQRAMCLAHLNDYRGALKDMEAVVRNHRTTGRRTQIEDFCSQGRMLLSVAEEGAAVKQYIKALQLEPSVALTTIPAGPEREALSKAFVRTAQSDVAAGHHREAWATVEYGLMVNPDDDELKKLRAKMKREGSGCRVH